MATVTAQLTQSGSAATVIHAQIGDTVTLKVKNVNHATNLAGIGAHLQALSFLTGINFAVDTTGGAS